MSFDDELGNFLNYAELSPTIPVSGELNPHFPQTGVQRPDAGLDAQPGPGAQQLAKKMEPSMASATADLRLDTEPFSMEGKKMQRESEVTR